MKSKPVLVLIHAFPMSSAMWVEQVKALGDTCQVLTPDMPGFGRTPLSGDVSNAKMAVRVAEGLDRMQITEPVVVGGLSMGGYVTLEFVRQFPKRVRAVGLFATRATGDSPEQQAKRSEQARFIELRGAEPFAEAMLPKLLGATTFQSRPDVVESVRKLMSEGQRPEGLMNALRAMAGRSDLTSTLPNIHCPTLIVVGQEDSVIPLEESQRMAQAIPNARLELIPQVGHLISLESPAKFNELLGQFIQNLSNVD